MLPVTLGIPTMIEESLEVLELFPAKVPPELLLLCVIFEVEAFYLWHTTPPRGPACGAGALDNLV